MALVPRLDQRQSQSLVMTPQLQQAIKLLQMSNMELNEFLIKELEQNPLLETEDIADSDTPLPEESGETNPENLSALEDIDFGAPSALELGTNSGLDVDYENIYTSNGLADDQTSAEMHLQHTEMAFDKSSFLGEGSGSAFTPDLEETLSKAPLLRDHLIDQLNLAFRNEIQRIIGLYLIDNLDNAGYLTIKLIDAASALGCNEELVRQTLNRLQTFDPPGIFARNLSECLALQLQDKNRLDPCIRKFLDNLELLASHKLKELEIICQCDAEDVTDMIQEIRSLSPKPAFAFDQTVAPPVIPDILMRPAPVDGWIVELNSDTLPRVLINNDYYAHVRKRARTKEEKTYIAEQIQSANGLVKALHQRASTIMKVSTELVRQQEMFFTYGVQHLKPLVLRDIADAIEMHESTVSRVTSNKYMATPRGMFELKYFFTSAIASFGDGNAHSAEAVRHRIKALIDDENTHKVLSDDKIVALLQSDGIDIARRTVAKYREAMGISSSVQRRREKNVFT